VTLISKKEIPHKRSQSQNNINLALTNNNFNNQNINDLEQLQNFSLSDIDQRNEYDEKDIEHDINLKNELNNRNEIEEEDNEDNSDSVDDNDMRVGLIRSNSNNFLSPKLQNNMITNNAINNNNHNSNAKINSNPTKKDDKITLNNFQKEISERTSNSSQTVKNPDSNINRLSRPKSSLSINTVINPVKVNPYEEELANNLGLGNTGNTHKPNNFVQIMQTSQSREGTSKTVEKYPVRRSELVKNDSINSNTKDNAKDKTKDHNIDNNKNESNNINPINNNQLIVDKQISQKLLEFNDEFKHFKQGMFKKMLDTDSKYADIENRTSMKLEELIQQIRTFIPININVNANSQVFSNNPNNNPNNLINNPNNNLINNQNNNKNKQQNIENYTSNKKNKIENLEEENPQLFFQDMRFVNNANTQRNSKSREVKVKLR